MQQVVRGGVYLAFYVKSIAGNDRACLLVVCHCSVESVGVEIVCDGSVGGSGDCFAVVHILNTPVSFIDKEASYR